MKEVQLSMTNTTIDVKNSRRNRIIIIENPNN